MGSNPSTPVEEFELEGNQPACRDEKGNQPACPDEKGNQPDCPDEKGNQPECPDEKGNQPPCPHEKGTDVDKDVFTCRYSVSCKQRNLEDFKRRLPEMIGNLDVKISKVRVYTNKLSSWQLTAAFFYHAFVVLETNGGWWWSVEMNQEEVIIQRNKKVEVVRDYLRTKPRKPVYKVPFKEDASDRSLKTFVDVLRDPRAPMNKEYYGQDNNCQHFAQFVFNRLAKTSRW